jgi:hypothetical protein
MPFPMEGGLGNVEFKGEAVAVDIAPGQTLFALLTGADGDVDYSKLSILREAYPQAYAAHEVPTPQMAPVILWSQPTIAGEASDKAHIQAGSRHYPMLVRFREIDDPRTLEQVKPEALDSAFAPGVKLRRITIAVTEAPVTVEIAKRLSWIDSLQKYRIDPNNPFTNDLPSEISGLRSR